MTRPVGQTGSMDEDRRDATDQPGSDGLSGLFTEVSPFSREGSVPPTPGPPSADPASWSAYPTTPPATPTPYGSNAYAPPANPYPAGPYPAPYGGYPPYGYAPVQNQKALLALIFGIAGFVLVSAFIGGFIGIAGIVLGRKARREI